MEPPKEEPKASFWDTPRVVGVVLTAVGVGGMVGGAVFGAKSSSDKDDADKLSTQLGRSGCVGANPPAACREQSDLRSSQDSNATLSKVMWISGGVLTAAGLATIVFWPHKHDVHVAATASARDAGLLVWGHF